MGFDGLVLDNSRRKGAETVGFEPTEPFTDLASSALPVFGSFTL
jgi:hypothetical protein